MPDRDPDLRLAIIDNSIHPEVYRPVAHWRSHLAVPFEAFTARDGRWPDPGRFTHIILTGSEASILEPEVWVEEEAQLVREAVDRGLAILGSCWGHQLLAMALTGPSHVARCARPEIGWIPIRLLVTSGLLGRAREEPYTFSVHFDEVRDLPRSFEVLASSALCPVQAMRLRGRPVWGLQCHPEIDVAAGRELLRNMRDMGFKGQAALAAALASGPRDSDLIRRIVPAFLGRPGPTP